MPEGPEVKIVSDYINKELDNSCIQSIECISSPYKLKYNSLVEYINQLTPQKFIPSFCRGKSTFIKFGEEIYLAYHLGMTGYWSRKKKKHAHLKIITDKKTLFFHDTRRFGNIKIINTQLLAKKYSITLDFLNYNGNIDWQIDFVLSLIKTNREVCKVLLDQRYFLGVGNYLKSEILYKSKVHPNTKWSKLTSKEKKIICINTRKCMIKSYNQGGAQIRDFSNPEIDSSLNLEVYNMSITADGLDVVNQKTRDNRVSFWCPDIQKEL